MEDVGLVDHQAAGRAFDRDLLVEPGAELRPRLADGHVARLGQRHDLGRRVGARHVGQQDERRHLRVAAVGARHDDGVVAIIAVVKLVVIHRAGIFRPELGLVEIDLLRLQEALRRVDEIGIDGEPVELPAVERKKLDAGELRFGVFRIGVGRGEIVLGLGMDRPQRLARRGERIRVDEVLHHGEAAIPDLGEVLIGHAHASHFCWQVPRGCRVPVPQKYINPVRPVLNTSSSASRRKRCVSLLSNGASTKNLSGGCRCPTMRFACTIPTVR